MWKLFKFGFKAAVGLGALCAALWGGTFLWVYAYGRASGGHEVEEGGEAIVVMGARVLPRGRPSMALRARAECAAKLFHQGVAPWVLVSGGKVDMPKSEAEAGCEVLMEQGVPAQACLREESSRSTAQNAEFSALLLRERGIGRIVLVSDGYHLLRAGAYFRSHGFSVRAVAAQRRLFWRDEVYWTAREAVALLSRPWMLWWALRL